jgi:type IV pilus assembly protein PilW
MEKHEGGFTLVELLIALAMTGVVAAGVAAAVEAGLMAVEIGGGRAESQANARRALQRIVPDIREAGYDPLAAGFAAVINQTATSVTLQSDRDSSGGIDLPVGACDPSAPSEIVRYQLVGNELRRSVNPGVAGCEAAVVGGVQALSFAYLDAGGAVTAVGADVRTVVISLTLRPETPGTNQYQPLAASAADRVRLRNR